MHCGTRAHATKACKIKVLAVFSKIARHKRAHTRVFSTRACKVDNELYCNIHSIFHYQVPLILTYIQLQPTSCGGPQATTQPHSMPYHLSLVPHGEPYDNYVANNSTRILHRKSCNFAWMQISLWYIYHDFMHNTRTL